MRTETGEVRFYNGRLLGECITRARGFLFATTVAMTALVTGYATGVASVRDLRLVALTVVCLVLLLPFLGSAARYGLLILLLFCFLALVRRVFPGPSNDPAAFLPTLLTLPLAVLAIQQRLPRHIALYLASILLAFALGLRQPLVACLGLAATAGPLLAGYWLNQKVLGQGKIAPYRMALAILMILVSIYGFYQFNNLPGFDRAWLEKTSFTTASLPGTAAFRPWSTLASPGTAAAFAALGLLALIPWRTRGVERTLQWAAVGLGVAFLALTKVRVGWVILLVGLILLLLSGVVRWRSVFVSVAVGTVLILTVAEGPVLTGVNDRADTLTALSEDRSTQSRLSVYRGFRAGLTAVPVGLGALSIGSRASRENSNDNGYVVTLREGGLLGLLGVLVLLLGQARASGPIGRALVAGLAVLHAAAPALVGLPIFLVFLLADRRRNPAPDPGMPRNSTAPRSRAPTKVGGVGDISRN